jgi:hypothetical protein
MHYGSGDGAGLEKAHVYRCLWTSLTLAWED